jgi:transcriptional regulator GlxA family with amidase domain
LGKNQINRVSLEALDWAMQNLCNNIDINTFAEKARMSRRTFDRKFRANLNLTPKEWLTYQRLNLAKELLENSEFSIEQAAELSGFGNAATMRHYFPCSNTSTGPILNMFSLGAVPTVRDGPACQICGMILPPAA